MNPDSSSAKKNSISEIEAINGKDAIATSSEGRKKSSLKKVDRKDVDDDFVSFEESSYSNLIHAGDLSESKSNQSKQKHAIKHVDHFLSKSDKFDVNSFDELNINNITDDMLGQMATYFATEARQGCCENKPLLRYQSANGYMSAFKSAYLKKFRK